MSSDDAASSITSGGDSTSSGAIGECAILVTIFELFFVSCSDVVTGWPPTIPPCVLAYQYSEIGSYRAAPFRSMQTYMIMMTRLGYSVHLLCSVSFTLRYSLCIVCIAEVIELKSLDLY